LSQEPDYAAEGGLSVSLYECVLIARNDVTQHQVEGIVDSIASQLETDGGAMVKREYWGLRSLAYRIKKNRKGHYVLMGLDAKPAFVTEMERQLRLNEDVLRFLTLSVAGIEAEPSAILSRRGDEHDRNFRGPKPAARFGNGPRRSFGDREEFRARDRDAASENADAGSLPSTDAPGNA
jgi:small subunit ribosomal protein S6